MISGSMTLTTTIIRADAVHLNDTADLFDAYRSFYGQAADLNLAKEFISARFEQNDSVIFLAFNETRAVGFTQLYPSYSSVAMKRIWILNDLFVVDSARKTKVATSLMGEAKRFSEETNAARLVLATATDNRPAQTLYEKTGWERDDAFIHYKFEI